MSVPTNRLRRHFITRLQQFLHKNLEGLIDDQVERHLLSRFLVYGDKSRLIIADTAIVNNALFNLISGWIIVEDYVFFGHNVSILTGTHDYHKLGIQRQTSAPDSGHDIIIKCGAWLASNVTVVGPCVIGEHSVVAACSLVNSNVPPYSIVAGIPARPIGSVQ